MEKKDWRWRLYKLLVYIDVDCGEQELGFAIGIEGVEKLEKLVESELDKAREEGNEELSEAMIKYLENMIVLVGAFNPMSEVIKARQEGELEAYKGILSKLKE